MTESAYYLTISGDTFTGFVLKILLVVFVLQLLDRLLVEAEKPIWRWISKRKRRPLYRHRRRPYVDNQWRWRNLREAACDFICDPTSTYTRHNLERALESLDEVAP